MPVHCRTTKTYTRVNIPAPSDRATGNGVGNGVGNVGVSNGNDNGNGEYLSQ